MADFLNDNLDDLLAAPMGEVRTVAPRAPADFVADRQFVEGCRKCGGSGQFRGWSGRSFGACFACKGAGKLTFKTSPEARAKSRTSAANKTAQKARDLAAEIAAWKEAHAEVWGW